MINYLTDDDALDIHDVLVEMFRSEDPIDPPGVRDSNLLGSALTRPMTGSGDVDKYDTIERKAAALFHSMVKNHPFHNGNKRTALVSMLVFLDRNGTRLNGDVSEDEIFDLVTAVAADDFPPTKPGLSDDEVVREVAGWLRDRSTRRTATLPEMNTSDFLEKCKLAGGAYRESGGSWIVFGSNGKNVRIGMDTRKLAGSVVRTYARKLGLAGASTGRYFDEFHEGLAPEQAILRDFRNVLRRLAHA